MFAAGSIPSCRSRCARSISKLQPANRRSAPTTPRAFIPIRHVEIDINKGLPELRKPWIVARGDVEFYQGREVKPEDNGLRRGEESAVSLFDRGRRQVLRAKRARR